MASKSLSGKTDNKMNRRAAKQKSGGKRKEMTDKEILQQKKRMEKDMKTLLDNIREDLQKEREIYRRELQNLKESFTQEIAALRAFVLLINRQVQWQNMRITSLQANAIIAMQQEIRRSRDQTEGRDA